MDESTRMIMNQWCFEEFSQIDLGDERLNQRFLQTASHLAQFPQSPITQACKTKAVIKGAYRLFSNERCIREEILTTHVERTCERMKGLPRVLAIQDTTVFEYGSHWKTEGLGPVAGKTGVAAHCFGLIAHTTLAVTPEGISLGLLDQRIWSRENPKFKTVIKGQKESSKWGEAAARVKELLPEGVEAITIADREADITNLLEWCCKEKMPFVIRARGRAIKGSKHQWLKDHLKNEPSVCEYEVEVAVKTCKKASKRIGTRAAQLSVHYGAVSIRTSSTTSGALPIYAVMVDEQNPPEGVEPLNWMLLTNVAVNSVDDAKERIKWYCSRWHIENFHRVLKSGCNVEQSRLQSAEKLDRFITLMSVIAWKLYWLTHMGRAQPEESCEKILSPEEWKILYCHIHSGTKYTLPAKPPTLREVTHWIGRLGGFMGTKKYPDPGVITMWRGYQRLNDMVAGYQLLKQHMAICG